MIEFLNSGKKKNILYFAKFLEVYFSSHINNLSKVLFKQMLEFEHLLTFYKMQNKDVGSIFINIDSFHWQSALWQSILNGS